MFGLMMLIDIPEERGGSILDIRFGKTTNCFFPLISFIKPMSASKMGLIYACLWLGALGITFGYKFRLSAPVFVATYWYIFLLDKSVWNNHSYLYDAFQRKTADDGEVPFWNYVVIKFQFCVLYIVAGLKKFSSEWLTGYAMMNLSYHWIFWPFRAVLGDQITDLLIIHWFVCIFDATIIFFIIYKPTRRGATILCAIFHLMNSRLFSIGMFPWLCLTELPLFYDRSWPRLLCKSDKKLKTIKRDDRRQLSQTIEFRQRLVVCLVLSYCSGQVFLPYSHFITEGYNGWTNGIYGYSWDMMIHAWDTTLTVVEVVDRSSNTHHFLHPNAFSVNDRWTKHPDMAYQYAHCIRRNLMENPLKIHSQNLSIHFDAWSSLNGRFQQRMFDPQVDMLKVEWSPLHKVPWMKPLLQQFTWKRTEMQKIAKDVLGWNNFSDVMFMADFPNQTMDSFISNDLDNITLTVLEGTVVHQLGYHGAVQTIENGQSVGIDSGKFHRVTTTSHTPSCFMYTYVNRTMQNIKTAKDESYESILPIWKEISNRAKNVRQFFQNIQNSVLFELYGIPMPVREKVNVI
ncbi:Vitamin K-dependent gamma-carboxylase [Pseudolycoriella hygida]|uniref:Vitamin K-dependent gamma-carboxylase n=1 Tax=Pseudolycoriella hygida TaxID=35572 RepID=A0A9Q0N064_9DIPT|nr:Vitamin K-dependent gamma-carboxylase [Pseudolycoriella hygida]